MNRVLTVLIAGAFAASLGACNKAEDPAETQADVAEAQADANQNAMESTEETAQAKAEGDHKVAIEQCEALPGDQQEACKSEADATYEAAKAAADLPGPS